MKPKEAIKALAQAVLSFTKGDILKFKTDNIIIYGLYIEHEYRQTVYADSYGQSGYIVFKILTFDKNSIETFYENEFIENLTGY